ncbi:hypothetical protein [Pedobacter nutrimenti]|jgi:hypothetical protein|uniref:Uncharacterized protein n=1 Tax=Pedobacter nutrimenti TaxID=1241337 RepID=A0A318UCC8_9SPHI|nr:hypothetical protein [Pedobacter nutrimenti]PYF73901.1 hypothetical protein B0O44_10471 [Pedobacter nutrimenti]
MRIQGIIGSLLMAAGGLCPLIRVPIIGNWNYFDIDQRLATAFYCLVTIALVGSLIQRASLIRFAGYAAIVLVGITLAGVYFKSHDYFSFVHFKKLINFAAGMVKYKWGWLVIAAGSLLLITVRKPVPVIIQQVPVNQA